MAALVVGPVGAATIPSGPASVAQATSTTTGGLTGTVTDDTGATVAGATITVRGVTTQTTTSDAKGAFQFSDLPAGLYSIVAQRAGYQTAQQSDFAVFAGEVERVAITLPRASFSSLRTIATVRSTTHATFNTSTASVTTISSQDFVNQSATQVMSALNELPGVQASYSADSTNPVSPAGASFPNIRNALSYETATLIDGHPVSVGRYGDYELNFINPFMLQSVEVIKGPGADALQTNYAIGGTVNFRTLDPTATATPMYTFGYDNFGGTFFNFGLSNTVGRLGFVFDIAGDNDPSPINNPVYIGNLNNGVAYVNGTNDVLGYNNSQTPIPGTDGAAYNEYNLRACCFTVTGNYDNLSELLKLRYKFSSATTATVSYLGSQTQADENGVTSQQTPSIFVPGAGYAGTVPLGATFLSNNVYPAPDTELNNEPILQAEVSTTLDNDTILARYYHASIYRLISQGGNNPNQPTWGVDTLSGTNSGGQTYNDVTVPVAWYEYYREDEIDKLGGTDFEYTHPYGDKGSTATFSWS
ncbi:MAG TPA: TonB-dependent receptor, partial [Candidatus Acidoferrales bacterium]|nr:TonB-dependent receptor [Candidatus Acidoferrales bacterium]